MFPDEKQNEEELKRFEADLAALVPRRVRVEPGWGEVLARVGRPCAEHVFACVYCGMGADSARISRRWAWPAAFSAMTTIAAALLVLLAVRPVQPTDGPGATANLPHLLAAGGSPRGSLAAAPGATAGFQRAQSSRLPNGAACAGGRATHGALTPMAAMNPKFFETLLASNSGPWPSSEPAASGSIGSDEEPLSAGAILRGGWPGRGELEELTRGLEDHGRRHSRGAEL